MLIFRDDISHILFTMESLRRGVSVEAWGEARHWRLVCGQGFEPLALSETDRLTGDPSTTPTVKLSNTLQFARCLSCTSAIARRSRHAMRCTP